MTKFPWHPAATTLTSPEGWNLHLLRYPGAVPLEDADRALLRRILQRLLAETGKDYPGFHPYGLVQYNQLNRGNAYRVMGDKFLAWRMDAGLGYWPHREPPALWTEEDFTELDIGEMPRPLMDQVFGINRGLEAILEAFSLLAGLGPMVFTLSEDSVQKVKERATALFQPLIEEPALRMFAYCYPLLCAATFDAKHADKLEGWTCGIHFFLRESPEENGIFIASRRPLERVWKATGAVESAPGVWTWPAEPPEKARKQD
ncbi:MAG: hypothetical protein ACPL7M_03655 [Bryobacteraceae bacterium]